MLFIQISFIIFIPAVTFKMLDLLHCFIIPVLLVHGFSVLLEVLKARGAL